LFPQEIVKTVIALSELHALTESLDTAMASNASMGERTPARYVQAWQKTGHRSDRETQIALTVALATRLEPPGCQIFRACRKPDSMHSVRLAAPRTSSA